MKKEKKDKKKKNNGPSTRIIMLYCEGCNSSDEHFMTNIEIFSKTIRLVWCSICNKMTNWGLKE